MGIRMDINPNLPGGAFKQRGVSDFVEGENRSLD